LEDTKIKHVSLLEQVDETKKKHAASVNEQEVLVDRQSSMTRRMAELETKVALLSEHRVSDLNFTLDNIHTVINLLHSVLREFPAHISR
jgi:uncharacterized coiled-coil protein SlyX